MRRLARCPLRTSLRLEPLLLLRCPQGRHSGGNVKVAYKSWRIPASRSFFVEKSGRVVQSTGGLTRFDHNGRERKREREKESTIHYHHSRLVGQRNERNYTIVLRVLAADQRSISRQISWPRISRNMLQA